MAFKTNIVKRLMFKWKETKTINSGGNNFTLVNAVAMGDTLSITDQKYGCIWDEGIHWTRNGQVITLTETALDENLTFNIVNMG